jgi:hypothetical protein
VTVSQRHAVMTQHRQHHVVVSATRNR